MQASEIFAANVKNLMKITGKTQAELAESADLSQKTISNILSDIHQPKLDVVEKTAAAFNLPAWQMIKPIFNEEI